MKAKIVIITSKYLHAFMEETVLGVKQDCDIQILEYNNFYHAIELYKEYEDQADGFMISGKAAQTVILKAFPEHRKPIVSFEASQVSEYRLFLELLLEDRQLDTRRIILDSMIPVTEDASVDYLLSYPIPFHIKNMIMDWLTGSSLEEIAGVEAQIVERITELWEGKKIDLVICHYGSIVPVLEQYRIPYRYSGPTREYLYSLLESLLSEIELKHLHDNLTGVIGVSAYSGDGQLISEKKMQEILISIKNDFALDVVFQEEEGYYYIFTTLRVIEHITDRFRKCSIRFKLKKEYDIEAYVGYGIGYNVTMAKGNAKDALKEAVFSKGCFVVDEQHNVLGPLDARNYFEVKTEMSDEVFRTADRCKLSSITIQKLLSIIEMTGSNRITQQNLAEHLGVTPRNASRILNNLVKGEAATVAYTKSMTSKGRPVKVYELNIKV